jgi:hypothetical protein
MPAAILSSLVQWNFIPPSHFSILTVQRGTITGPIAPGIADGAGIAPADIPGIAIPGIAIPVRSIIIAVFIH